LTFSISTPIPHPSRADFFKDMVMGKDLTHKGIQRLHGTNTSHQIGKTTMLYPGIPYPARKPFRVLACTGPVGQKLYSKDERYIQIRCMVPLACEPMMRIRRIIG
jgi:hypothetical protein